MRIFAEAVAHVAAHRDDVLAEVRDTAAAGVLDPEPEAAG